MKKHVLIFIGVIVIAIICGLAWYVFVYEKNNETQKIITAFRLEKFDANAEIKPGAKGIETTSFKKGELMGISGEAIVPPNTGLTIKFFDKNEHVLEGDIPGIRLKRSGTFGLCCFNISEDPGTYTIRLYLDGTEAKSLLFEVK